MKTEPESGIIVDAIPFKVENITIGVKAGLMIRVKQTDDFKKLKEEVTQILRQHCQSIGQFWTPDIPPFMTITGPCGHKTNYQTLDYIPMIDVPCPCGENNCYQLKYDIH